MEPDGLAPTLIMTTGLQRPEVPQAATDAYAVTRARTSRSSRMGETCKGYPSPTDGSSLVRSYYLSKQMAPSYHFSGVGIFGLSVSH
jgi:hypothetical protein